MTRTTTVDATRDALGRIGVLLPVSFTSTPSVELQREAVGRLARLGYRAAWVNEVIGKDALVQLAVLLAATPHLVLGTSVANIWVRPAPTLHAAAAQLAQAYPGRLVLGLGVGYPQQADVVGRTFGSPLTTMRDYLRQAETPTQPPAPDVAYPLLLAANGPKMLALAAETTDGALPAGQPVSATAAARHILGPDKLLVVGVPARLGAGPADAPLAARAREHLSAGADHVIVMLERGVDYGVGIDQLERLAPELTALSS